MRNVNNKMRWFDPKSIQNQYDLKDSEHKCKAHTNVGESDMCIVENDIQECKQIVTDSFVSTPTRLEEGTRRHQ